MLFDAWNCDELLAAVIHFLSDFIFNKHCRQNKFSSQRGKDKYFIIILSQMIKCMKSLILNCGACHFQFLEESPRQINNLENNIFWKFASARLYIYFLSSSR